MPYIEKHIRPVVAQGGATNPGELNYELTLAIREYLRENAPLKYDQINHVVSAIDLVKRTFRCGPPRDVTLYARIWLACDIYVKNTQRHDVTGNPINHPEFDALGALECCKLEFYRRVAAPYEDSKIISNGDVY